MKDDDKKIEPRIEIGPLCPPIKSWFFPLDKSLEPYELENEDGKVEHPPQST
jgi:hypothetical protein